ncbi:MAG TPA: VWA domain-containing protein [Thermoanaerobaculia bacterium]|nr:VWA domain-containing protein [Thermoanaerobaculia bacterium]
MRASIFLGLLVLALPSSLRAEGPQDVFAERTEVRLVELGVRVLRDGEPVRGLDSSDFIVLDRGRSVVISGFEVLERGSATGEVAVAASGHRPHRLLLLFDFAYSSGAGLARAVAASRRIVAPGLERGSEVGVGFFSALRGMRLVAPVSGKLDIVQAGLDCISALLARQPEVAELSLRRAMSGRGEAAAVPYASGDEVRAEATIMVRADPYWPHRSVIRSQARGLRRIAETAEFEAGPVQVIWFSHGFDSSFLTGRGGASSLSELERTFRALRQRAWVVDAINVDGVRIGTGRESLFYLANETGGDAYENFNRPSEALELMLRRRSVTYLLVLDVSQAKPDGRFHRLKVRLRDGLPGARIRHRPGYYAPELELDTPLPRS